MSKKVRLPAQPSDHGQGPHYPPAPKQEFVFRGLILAAAVVIVLAGIKAASGIIAPMLLALFATIILLVPLRWLESKGCPRILALVIVLGCVAIFFFGMTRLVVNSISTELSKEKRESYARKINREFQRLEDVLETWGYRLNSGFDKKTEPQENGYETLSSEEIDTPRINSAIETDIAKPLPPQQEPSQAVSLSPSLDFPADDAEEDKSDEGADQSSKTILDRMGDTYSISVPPSYDDPLPNEEVLPFVQQAPQAVELSLIELNAQSLYNWFTKTAEVARQMIERSFLVFIITLFMIFEASRFPAKIDRAFGKGPITNEHLHKIATEIRRYLFLKAFTSCLSGIAATLVYWWFDVPGFMFWGLVACFLYFIPNLGGIIASIIPGLLIFMDGGVPAVLLYAVCLTAIECTLAYGIDPKILGHGLGISTVVIILSLIIWGWLLGAIGLFLAAPLTIMVKIILQAFKETEWVAVLIGDGSLRSQ
ncbi:MAG: AI-2E family transporter [Planctomycetaceae bacterium]|nr:AI-2E family transporter [Planctomycetaceae bacterium]